MDRESMCPFSTPPLVVVERADARILIQTDSQCRSARELSVFDRMHCRSVRPLGNATMVETSHRGVQPRSNCRGPLKPSRTIQPTQERS